ncbi:MAG: autoantigen p27 domain-containing protein [Methanomicrobiales archaeon]|nr:autoantigen p27 domain-containing protein [Methanomicrobiales archaeon]MDI6877265.1 autoantigen p27 domain-containing protein [Methanomicrobiales archaeon]
MKAPDEIMAEYLLKGGKMLSRACAECGSPLFEYKGRTCCVVCEHPRDEEQPAEAPVPPAAAPHAGERRAAENPAIEVALQETLIELCRRIQAEPDPNRCLLLMQCLREGIAALREIG